jgi:1,2-diacylglycerol 3-beta-galactosyltransferase
MFVRIEMPRRLDLSAQNSAPSHTELGLHTPTARRTVLFLIADTGAGHRSAARAIARALRLVDEHERAPGETAATTAVLTVDAFARCARFALRETVFLYGPVTQHRPRLYGHLFHLTNSAWRFHAVNRVCQPFLRQGIRSLLAATRPDVIVSVHPLLNHVTLHALADLGLKTPLVTVVTDPVNAHSAWFARDVAACAVPTPVVRDLALANGLDASRVHVLGMPIDPAFTLPITATRAERRAAIGIAPDLPAVLVIGGGDGAYGLAETVHALASARLDAQLLVVTGHNHRLYAGLQRLQPRFQMPTKILGFVRNMPELMRAADIVVTKAGPGTISEAIASELPIVLTGAIPGQEEGNVGLVLEHGLGVLAATPDILIRQVADLLDPSSPRLQHMRSRMRACASTIANPYAAFGIARLITACAPMIPTQSSSHSLLERDREHSRTQSAPLVPALQPCHSRSRSGSCSRE